MDHVFLQVLFQRAQSSHVALPSEGLLMDRSRCWKLLLHAGESLLWLMFAVYFVLGPDDAIQERRMAKMDSKLQ